MLNKCVELLCGRVNSVFRWMRKVYEKSYRSVSQGEYVPPSILDSRSFGYFHHRPVRRVEARLPVETEANGVTVYREQGAIYNPSCAYVFLSFGHVSIESGVKFEMPAWDDPGRFTYPNGVSDTVHNRNVLVLRPIGYKESPNLSLSSIREGELGVPDDRAGYG